MAVREELQQALWHPPHWEAMSILCIPLGQNSLLNSFSQDEMAFMRALQMVFGVIRSFKKNTMYKIRNDKVIQTPYKLEIR